jgi:hypothetical protein
VKASFTCSRCTFALAQRNTLMSPASMATNNNISKQRQCGTCRRASSNCLLLACPAHKDSRDQSLRSIKGGEAAQEGCISVNTVRIQDTKLRDMQADS